MPYAFTLTTTIPASAEEIYDAWLNSVAHSEITRAVASMSDEIGTDVSAWDGYITGRNLELVPGQRIVQSWRTADFIDEHEDSIITLALEEIEGGTLLTLAHTNVPDGQTSYELGGWQEHYFEPMKEYFANRQPTAVGKRSKEAASPAKRPAGREKSKRAAPRTTASKGKSTVPAKHKRAGATRGKSKAARSKPRR